MLTALQLTMGPTIKVLCWCTHVATLTIYKLVFNQNYYTFTLIFPTNIVLYCIFSCTQSINYECFEMSALSGSGGSAESSQGGGAS
jgi:hypothetical protein